MSTFLPAYLGATLITDALLGRPGLPTSPLLWLLVAAPLGIVLVRLEESVQARPDWEKVEDLWYGTGVGLLTLPPLGLALFTAAPVLTSLPRGGPSALVVAVLVLVVGVIVVRGKMRGTA
ncbi:hypothetical protein HQ325_04435 [Rhodococcus sp. BP-349]|uniref:hypothetical protein n=1 Tax=unclassified Rhodococcus (in: high G+C Gram-positive bacteria) TaxID=192944 RepID=UPI001C9B20F8|nr:MULTISPECIES: hypothetical protein [unclassified Rhodococcus (in: high G+C Gram-positive bacteria)]MBY6594057.1 hypothetical protein [Rhodococcus sp. BP-359]MBY6620083.1 hypothetical protein [Rhodococcus sp. BP-357]MBY6537913.1 hypothetical protein [Rhodococcus sp. BP-363]MBY6542250.1 hypothetical protein [Rhodococcus sp. BP-369]MBY6561480.1 hypothetical protein [Rhodococcus sp. BP-370]